MSSFLDHYKEIYGHVFLLEFGGLEFIFRPLTRKEYKRITEQVYEDEFQAEEVICATATLHPEGYDFAGNGLAGIVKALSQRIIEVSGYATPDQQTQMLDHYRYEMNRFDTQAETIIALVFPGTTPEEMQDWTQEKLINRLARAEWVMRTIWGMPFEFGARQEEDPDAPQEEPKTLKEMGDEIREQGGDPMMALSHLYRQKPDKNYVQFPLLGGTKLFQNEEVLTNVREQIQRLPD